jgi:ABC-type branched-subunit amino acid transport system substrate-binding protein
MILAHALKQGGADKTKVREGLEGLKVYTAVSGKQGSTISYSPSDHRRASPGDLVWRLVENGKFANAAVE